MRDCCRVRRERVGWRHHLPCLYDKGSFQLRWLPFASMGRWCMAVVLTVTMVCSTACGSKPTSGAPTSATTTADGVMVSGQFYPYASSVQVFGPFALTADGQQYISPQSISDLPAGWRVVTGPSWTDDDHPHADDIITFRPPHRVEELPVVPRVPPSEKTRRSRA